MDLGVILSRNILQTNMQNEAQRDVEIRRCITLIHQSMWLNTYAQKLMEWWNGLSVELKEQFLANESLLYAALGYENNYKDLLNK
jgi:hypothetical protein